MSSGDPFDELFSTRSPTAASKQGPSGTASHGARAGVAVDTFGDLLSTDVAPPAGPQPMRRPPPPPPQQQHRPPPPPPSASAASLVDGVSQATLDAWFELADNDKDGRVANAEAVQFFLHSGLSPVELRKIYLLVKTPELNAREGVGLNKLRFAQVLRLIALAQSGIPFTDENAQAALDPASWRARHGRPLPAPRLALRASPGAAPAAAGVSAAGAPASSAGAGGQAGALDVSVLEGLAAPAKQQQEEQSVMSEDSYSALEVGTAGAPAAGADSDDDDDLFGLKKLRLREQQAAAAAGASGDASSDAGAESEGRGVPARSLSRMKARSERNLERERTCKPVTSEGQLAFEVRLPPLNPKLSAKLSVLAAGAGSLFAGPGTKAAGVLQWAQPEGNLQPPQHPLTGAELPRAALEDSDAAPCAEVHLAARKEATCLLVDPLASVLWVGDKEGWVSGYDISGKPGTAVGSIAGAAPERLLYQWQAYGVGSLSSMCVTPAGELWTGSSRGNIRVWELAGRESTAGRTQEPAVCRELRRPMGERPHGGAVLALVCPSDGQLVWSTSGKTILLWDAGSGAFLGVLHRVMGKVLQGMVIDAAASQAEILLKYSIKSTQGLELDPATGAVKCRPTPAERAKLADEQAAAAAQTDKGVSEFVERVAMGGTKVVQGAGKAIKFLGKFGAKMTRNLGSTDLDTTPAKSMTLPDDELGTVGSMRGGRSFNAEERSTRICAVVVTPDNCVWVGHNKGRIDRYTAAGRLVWSKEIAGNLQTLLSVGRNIWVGFGNGMLSVLDADGNALTVFPAHGAGIISMAQAGSRTYTLAADGSIKGWSSALPVQAEGVDALAEWDTLAASCVRQDVLRVLCVTWNVGESKPSQRSPFFTQLDGKVNVIDPTIQLVVVGLQEIEMGGSSVAVAAAKDVLSYRLQERGNTNAKFWSTRVHEALGGEAAWYQIALRQLSGMLILVFARSALKNCIGEVATASVACGVLGVGGNKGAVAIEFTLHRRKVAAICSHFAAHQNMVRERNANYEQIVRQLAFKRKPWFAAERGGGGGGGEEGEDELDAGAITRRRLGAAAEPGDEARSEEGSEGPGGLEGEDLIQGEGVRNAKLLLWMGDFNYRIDDLSYLEVKEAITREKWDALLQKDQCRQQWAAGNVFRGMQEGPIRFRPTYKFDKGDSNPEAYDTSEKQRIPAWCDRVFFRGTVPEEEVLDSERLSAQALDYNCWLDVLDSDHKPVYARLEVNLPVINRERKRQIVAQLLRQQCSCEGAPERVQLHPLQLGPECLGLQVSNGGTTAARFHVGLDSAAASVLGYSVEALPVAGVVAPGEVVDVHLLLGNLPDFPVLRHHTGKPKVEVEPEGGWDPKAAASLRWVDGKVVLQPELSRGSERVQQLAVERSFRVTWAKGPSMATLIQALAPPPL